MKNFKRWQKVCIALCGIGLLFSILLFVPIVQNLILDFGENVVVHRPLTRPVWIGRFIKHGIYCCFIFVVFIPTAIFLYEQGNRNRLITPFYKYELFFYAAAIFIFAILNIVTINFHEHWRDEAQSWLIAKYTSVPDLIFKILPSEGHPCLFYLILMPFAKSGFDYNYLSCITFSFVLAAALIFIKYSKINPPVKILLLFTPVFMYFPGVIARSYCLIPLELVIVCCFYEKRKNLPILWGVNIALMLQTHIYLAGLCGVLMVQELVDCILEKNKKEKVRIFVGGIIATASLVLLLIELGAGNSNGSSSFASVIQNPISSIMKNKNVIVFLIANCFFTSKLNAIFSAIIFFLILGKAILNFKKCAWEFCIFIGTFANILIIFFIYKGGHASHKAALSAIFLLCFYLIKSKVQWGNFEKLNLEFIENTIFVLIFTLSVGMTGFDYIARDIKEPFSSSKNMANYLNKNFDGETNFVVNGNSMLYCSVSAYLKNSLHLIYPSDGSKMDFIHLGTARTEDYYLWNESNSNKLTLYLSCVQIKSNELELIHSEENAFFGGENYYLYRKKSEQ